MRMPLGATPSRSKRRRRSETTSPSGAESAWSPFRRLDPRPPSAAARRVQVLPERLVIQVRREPSLDLLGGHPLAGGVGGDLVATDLADGEVARIGVGEIESANGGGRVHCKGLGQSDAGRALGLEQVEQDPLLRVVGAGGITWRGPDAAVALGNQLLL